MRLGDDNLKTYKMRDGYPKLDCAKEWKRHRRNKWIVWLLVPGWIPYGVLVVFIMATLNVQSDRAFAVAMSAYAFAEGVFTLRVSFFPCPRCGSSFKAWSQWGLGYKGTPEKCRNCGLGKWQCESQTETVR